MTQVVSELAPVLPAAGYDELPEILVSPPWTVSAKQRRTPSVVIPDLAPPAPSATWRDGERESWSRTHSAVYPADTDWDRLAAEYRAGTLPTYRHQSFFIEAPDEIADSLFHSRTALFRCTTADGCGLLSRYGHAALSLLEAPIYRGRKNVATEATWASPFVDTTIASQMAEWFGQRKAMRPVVVDWLERHGIAAVRTLLPAAFGPAGGRRRHAEALLRLFGRTDEVIAVAAEHSEQAAAAVAAMLAVDPLEILPKNPPKIGDWLDPRLLPQIPLRGRKAALPSDGVGHLITMLSISTPDQRYAGIDVVREVCEPAPLAEWAWRLFQEWQLANMPSKDGWVLTALGWLGDDETVRRLTRLIRAWPGDGQHRRALTGLDVLATIGTDVALMHLHAISQNVKFTGLKKHAIAKMASVADERGLRPEQLADRLVPDCGLDSTGTLTLDYGPRRFTVGFDESLKPVLTDDAGKIRKSLPKPGARDDAELAPQAYARFAALKKDVRTLAANQLRRLEQAMVVGRRWSDQEFRDYLVDHPLVSHLVRRLVWLAETTGGKPASSFRVAEDGTFADAQDETITFPADTEIRLAHRLHLSEDTIKAWAGVLGDYKILQPFPQLGRAVHVLSEAERSAPTLSRLDGITIEPARILGLVPRGWVRAEPQDGGGQPWITRPLGDGQAVIVELYPGVGVGPYSAADMSDQEVTAIWIGSENYGGERRPADSALFGSLDPITTSEILGDLLGLTEQR
ncbi:DUF4132 domain-containing protein [Actinoalloteichus hymeniacidonis]|uniref:DUF4132 family protein n=1 Tax=Actinoalloteichus hymeniacidonis TaxID=340345 RepID=A0AAC9HR78_9PSEU|nr:DUF4132 domain-containing protein [Actinoalloteichus hymeniacidonis]AOS63955.1 putative DUF4132 family protein [Actinoalloteichus hymeniacidonis]MBB5907988.1 hypothetical protein [Actinoalloteichus hymeniacidonis]